LNVGSDLLAALVAAVLKADKCRKNHLRPEPVEGGKVRFSATGKVQTGVLLLISRS